MNDNLLKHIKAYFNSFNQKDYMIHVDGTPTEWCGLDNYSNYVMWKIPLDSNDSDWHKFNVCLIEAIRLTPTTMEIVTPNGKEYKLVAKPKAKEKRAKEIIGNAKMSLYTHMYDDVLKHLDALQALMDE